MAATFFQRSTLQGAVRAAFVTAAMWGAAGAVGQDAAPSPASRLRPLDQPSRVAAFARPTQTAYMQAPEFALPGATPGTAAAPITAPPNSPAPPGLQPLPAGPAADSATQVPPGLRPVPQTAPSLTSPPLTSPPSGASPLVRGNPGFSGASPSDLAPIRPPQLEQQFATMGNCNLVSGPSNYRAEFWGCGPAAIPAGVPPYAYPQTVVPPTVMPPTVIPGVAQTAPYIGTVGHRPLFTLGQENYNVQLGQGIIGQPTAYVPGQGIRNFIRYLSP